MTGPAAGFERRVHAALDASPSRIPVLLGGCGTGRTWLLQRLRDRIGRQAAQYIDVERCATTPERFLQAVTSTSPFRWHGAEPAPATAREAFDALLAFFDTARAPGGEPCTFLLDEVLELRTFESFPGLRHVLRELIDALAESPNRFVLTTRYIGPGASPAPRRHGPLRGDAPAGADSRSTSPTCWRRSSATTSAWRPTIATISDARSQALTDGRAVYVKAIGDDDGRTPAACPIRSAR